MLFYLEKGDIKTSLKYLLQSAKQGCELAYGQIGIILYLEKNKINEAVNGSKKRKRQIVSLRQLHIISGFCYIWKREKGAKALNIFKRRQEKDMTWHTEN